MTETLNSTRHAPHARRLPAALAAVAVLGCTALISIGFVAAHAATPAPAATGSNTAGLILDDKQTAALKDVSKYFNDLVQLKGSFLQTNADAKRLRGKFFIKQPGRFRFDYASGSKMVIVSDGKYLAVQDYDLKTDSRWELDRTPFRMLLRKDVDLIRDANLLDVQDADDLVIISLQDKDPDTVGRIKLFFAKKPTLELKEWVTTDAQGLDTRIEISELNRTEAIAPEVFTPPSPALQNLRQNGP